MNSEITLSALSDEQIKILENAFPQITVLVSGADGSIDKKELKWAEKVTNIRSYSGEKELFEFYDRIEENLTSKVENLLKEMPVSIEERENILSQNLASVNDVLSCLNNRTAYTIYDDLTSFAEHIAKASGGFFRFGSVNSSEKKWISLPMISPIELIEEVSPEE